MILLQTLLFTAENYFRLGNFTEAKWYCEEFISLNSTYREPYFLLAVIYNESHVYTMAEAAFLAGLKNGVQKKDWIEQQKTWTTDEYTIPGAIYLNMKKYSEAAAQLKKALSLDPNNLEVWKQYSFALEKHIEKIDLK
jgi:Tfp pilus assembly protein PilF